MRQSKKLGDILVEKDLLCRLTVERVSDIAKRLGRKMGVVLEEMGLITEEELVHCLASQYNLRPLLNFAKASFAPEALSIIPAEVALANMIFPLKLERGRLALAISDPTSTRLINNLAANSGLTVVPYISTRKEIKAAICRHYLGKDCMEPSRKTVLIVEDDNAVRAVLQETLSKHYQVLTAVDGLDAYKEVISKKPHVVLTDKEMPKLSGFALLGALRSIPETKQIPVILISGTDSDEAESEAFEKGFFDFLPKPVKESTLLTRVKRAYDFSEKQNYLFMR